MAQQKGLMSSKIVLEKRRKKLKLIEGWCNVLFLSAFGLKLDVKNERKKYLECVRIHI